MTTTLHAHNASCFGRPESVNISFLFRTRFFFGTYSTFYFSFSAPVRGVANFKKSPIFTVAISLIKVSQHYVYRLFAKKNEKKKKISLEIVKNYTFLLNFSVTKLIKKGHVTFNLTFALHKDYTTTSGVEVF